MLYVHIPGRRAALMDSADSILAVELSWRISIFAGFEEDMITGAKEERNRGLSNSR